MAGLRPVPEKEEGTPAPRPRELSAHTGLVQSIMSSNLPAEKQAEALVALLDMITEEPKSKKKKGGRDDDPPSSSSSKITAIVMAVFLGISLLGDLRGYLVGDEASASEIETQKTLTELVEEVSALRAEAGAARVEQQEFDYFLVEGIKEVEKALPGTEVTSINYLERLQGARERNKQ